MTLDRTGMIGKENNWVAWIRQTAYRLYCGAGARRDQQDSCNPTHQHAEDQTQKEISVPPVNEQD
jgi:hypothetical protein